MRLPALVFSTLALLVQSAAPAASEPLDIRFVPPDIARAPICQPRPTEEGLVARWTGRDGTLPPDLTTAQTRRDLRLLRGMDADHWFDTIAAAMLRLHEIDTGYSDADMLMDQIDLHVAAGRITEMVDAGLIEGLIALDTATSLRAQLLLSELLLSGTGIARDRDRGMGYLVAAGYGGNSEALLHLAEMTIDGVQVPGWDISPEVAVTLAFGGLVGGLDPAICDRMNRIAHEFRAGTLVRQDMPLAEDWFRLSADLGDFNAAWDVAQMHLHSNGIVKDNATLLRYLEQAAAAGLPRALSQLGRIYEIGALADQDLGRARDLYTRAVAAGDPLALVRLTQLLGGLADPTPEDLAAWRENLERLTALEDPPQWALIRLGDDVLAQQGRWAGEAEALALYQRAYDIDSTQPLTISRFVALRLHGLSDEQSFLDLVGPLERSVRINGSNGPIVQLHNAYLCQTPRSPDLHRARFWADAEQISANTTPEFAGRTLPGPDGDAHLHLLADVQSQALSGRGGAQAIFAALQQRSEDIPGDMALLQTLARDANTSPLTEAAKLEMRLSGEDPASADILDMLRAAHAAGEPDAPVQLLRALAGDPDLRAAYLPDIETLASALARQGNGAAMRTLVELGGGEVDARAAVLGRYGETIAARGDFNALILALESLSDGPQAEDYLRRARAVMTCDLRSALDMAGAMDRFARQADVETWLDVAASMVDDVGWQLVAMGDAVLDLSARPDATGRAVALFRRATQAGNRVGVWRLLALRDDDGFNLDIDDRGTADLYIELVALTDVRGIPNVLDRLRFEPPAVQQMVTDTVDPRLIYADAALAGSPFAQLELARILRRESDGPDALARYATLLTSAAEQGVAEAMALLSEAYSYGLGVPPSLEASRDWLVRAAEAGNAEAMATVLLLSSQEISE